MHPELEDLFVRATKLAKRKLNEDGRVPVFGAVLDSYAKPLILNPVYEEGAPVRVMSVAAHVEVLRLMVKQSETSGAVICAPMQVFADDGTTYQGFEVHGDHAFDESALRMVVRFARVDERWVFDEPVWEETDDLLVGR